MGWKVGKENNQIQCSLCKSPTVYLEPIPRQKIELLMEEYKNQEWLGYLVGRISEKEKIFVEDLVIPPHKEAYSASAEALPFYIPDKCVGVIHSHHTLGAFHSSTDQAYIDRNFPVSITVARREQALEFDAVSYQITPCGKAMTGKSTIKYVQLPLLFDGKTFLEEAKRNIDKGKRVFIYPQLTKYSLEDNYIPARFRLSQGEHRRNNIVDENEAILAQKELEALIAQWEADAWWMSEGGYVEPLGEDEVDIISEQWFEEIIRD